MFSKISKWLLHLWGFKLTGKIDKFPKKTMFVIMPHTSNWDFPLGVLVRSAINIKIKYFGKDSLFKWPHGFIFRWLGGIPVDRSKNNNFVKASVEAISKYDELSLGIAPEGTRKRVDKLKSGFYWIAHEAKMPIVMVKFDFKNKEVNFSEPWNTCGDFEKDLLIIDEHFKGTEGRNPQYGYKYEAK
jgi:1-acyl-sn-glycerol-3-phosphate acyltransferase